MAWTNPSSYSAGEIVTAAKLNSDVYSNLRFLKGLDGAISLDNHLQMGANELRLGASSDVALSRWSGGAELFVNKPIRGHNGQGGFSTWHSTGALGTSAQMIIPDATGDVTQYATVNGVWRNSATTDVSTISGITVTPGGSIWTAGLTGGGSWNLRAQVNGQLDIYITGTANTFFFSLWVLWR